MTSMILASWLTAPVGVSHYLVVGAVLFVCGALCMATKRNALGVLMGIELVLNGANLNFIAFWRHSPNAEALQGVLFAIFSIAIAAAEAAVGLALIIAIFRHYRTSNVDEVDRMKG